MARSLIRLLRRTSIPVRTIVLAVLLLLLLPMAATSAYIFWAGQRAAVMMYEAERVAAMSDAVSQVHSGFQDLLYWRADLAVSLLTLAETKGNDARARADAGRRGPCRAEAVHAGRGRRDQRRRRRL